MGCKQTPTRNTGDSNNVYCSGDWQACPLHAWLPAAAPGWRHTALVVSGRKMPSTHTVRRERCKPHRCTRHHYTQKPQEQCILSGHAGCGTLRWVALSVKAQPTASHNAMYRCRNTLNNVAKTQSCQACVAKATDMPSTSTAALLCSSTEQPVHTRTHISPHKQRTLQAAEWLGG